KSHDFGLVPALAFANYYPERVRGIFAVSPPPLFLPDSDLSAIPIQQRAFIWAARHSFWMIKLLLRVGHVKARKLGPAQWMQMVFDGTPDELKVFQTDAGREVSENSYHFNLIQNSKGQVFDMQFSLANDWAELLREVKVPLAGLTGKRNTTFDVNAVRALKLINPNFDIKEIEMASLTLALTDAEACHYTFLDLMKVTGSVPVS
ncbi:MAG: alpha/beta hydrolase, partial [Amphritea sp.]|nr:alpha/beta hydrolase [Amphritea sp.]